MKSDFVPVARPAAKKRAKLRVLLDGQPGAGKTYSAILIAKLLIGEPLKLPEGQRSKVFVIDTERSSSELYQDVFDFQILPLPRPHHSPADYKACLQYVEGEGAEVVIFDSITHEWSWCLQEVDRVGAKRAGNTWAAWGAVRPPHDDFVDAMMGSAVHVIATVRAAPETVQRKTESGQTKVEKIGMKQIQDSMIEFAFTIVVHLDAAHTGTVTKTRCAGIDQKEYPLFGENFVRDVKAWLESGVPSMPIVHTLGELSAATERDMITAGEAKNKEHYAAALQNFEVWCRSHAVPLDTGRTALEAVKANVKAALGRNTVSGAAGPGSDRPSPSTPPAA